MAGAYNEKRVRLLDQEINDWFACSDEKSD